MYKIITAGNMYLANIFYYSTSYGTAMIYGYNNYCRFIYRSSNTWADTLDIATNVKSKYSGDDVVIGNNASSWLGVNDITKRGGIYSATERYFVLTIPYNNLIAHNMTTVEFLYRKSYSGSTGSFISTIKGLLYFDNTPNSVVASNSLILLGQYDSSDSLEVYYYYNTANNCINIYFSRIAYSFLYIQFIHSVNNGSFWLVGNSTLDMTDTLPSGAVQFTTYITNTTKLYP